MRVDELDKKILLTLLKSKKPVGLYEISKKVFKKGSQWRKIKYRIKERWEKNGVVSLRGPGYVVDRKKCFIDGGDIVFRRGRKKIVFKATKFLIIMPTRKEVTVVSL